MARITRAQYERDLDRIWEHYCGSATSVTPLQGRSVDEMTAAIDAYKQTAVIIESAPAAAKPVAGKRPKTVPSKRAQRIAKSVAESLAAKMQPKAAAVSTAAQPGVPLHETDGDVLAGQLVRGLGTGTVSPFWTRPGESVPAAPAAPVTETTTPAAGKPLHLMTNDELLAHASATLTAATPALKSPLWGGASNG